MAPTGLKAPRAGSGDSFHLGLDQIGRPALRLGHRAENQIREQFRVAPVPGFRVDGQGLKHAAPVHPDPNQAGTRRSFR
jgi:hypothetical protein